MPRCANARSTTWIEEDELGLERGDLGQGVLHVHGLADNFNVGKAQDRTAKYIAADAAKAVDSKFDGHDKSKNRGGERVLLEPPPGVNQQHLYIIT